MSVSAGAWPRSSGGDREASDSDRLVVVFRIGCNRNPKLGGTAMRRRFIMILLGLGAIGGFASEIASHCCARRHYAQYQHQQQVNDMAQACLNAARLR